MLESAIPTVSNFNTSTQKIGSQLTFLGASLPNPKDIASKNVNREEVECILIDVGKPFYERLMEEFRKNDEINVKTLKETTIELVKDKNIKRKLEQLVSLSRNEIITLLENLLSIQIESISNKISLYENEISNQVIPSEELVLVWLQAMYNCKSTLENLSSQVKILNFVTKFMTEFFKTREFQRIIEIKKIAPHIFSSWSTIFSFNEYYSKLIAQLIQIILRIDQQEKILIEELKSDKPKDHSKYIEALVNDISRLNQISTEKEVFKLESVGIPEGFEGFLNELLR